MFTKARRVLGFSVWIIAGERPPLPQDRLLRTNWNRSALNNLQALITPRLTLASILLPLSLEVQSLEISKGCRVPLFSRRYLTGQSREMPCPKVCVVLISPSLTSDFCHGPVVLFHLLTILQRTFMWPVPGDTCTESGPLLAGTWCALQLSPLLSPHPTFRFSLFYFPPLKWNITLCPASELLLSRVQEYFCVCAATFSLLEKCHPGPHPKKKKRGEGREISWSHQHVFISRTISHHCWAGSARLQTERWELLFIRKSSSPF